MYERTNVTVYAHYGNFTSEPLENVSFSKPTLIYQNHAVNVYLRRSKHASRTDCNRLAYAAQVIVEGENLPWSGMVDVNKAPPRKKRAQKHVEKSSEFMEKLL